MMSTYRVFISCVSAEFKNYRESLRKNITNNWREVKVQEDFTVGGGSLLEKLDDYIQRCQPIIHLIGEDCGSKAKPAEVRRLAGSLILISKQCYRTGRWRGQLH